MIIRDQEKEKSELYRYGTGVGGMRNRLFLILTATDMVASGRNRHSLVHGVVSCTLEDYVVSFQILNLTRGRLPDTCLGLLHNTPPL